MLTTIARYGARVVPNWSRSSTIAACACADVPPGRFSLLSLMSSAAWAGAPMGVIAWLGSRTLEELGVRGWWTPVVPGLLVLAFGWWLSHAEKVADESSGG